MVNYRRILIGVAVLTLFGLSICADGASCFPPPSGLLGWWPGDGSAGDIAGANNGALQGGATANAAGVSGSAFSFDGTNAYVQIADAPSLQPTNLTIECWVLFTGLDSAGFGGSPAGDQYIVFRQNTLSGGFEGFALAKTRDGGSDWFNFTVASADGQAVGINSSTAISTGVWYHVAAARGSNFIQLFVNGVAESQASVDFPQDYGSYPLYFGTSGQSYWDHRLKGRLDEVSIYDRALTPAQIAAIAGAGAAGKCQLPYVTSVPTNQALLPGVTATFSITAIGLGPIRYQWSHEGTNVVDGPRVYGATNSILTLSNIIVNDGGNYSVVVSNSRGGLAPYSAHLQVGTAPNITIQPTNLTVLVGSSASFQSGAAGAPAPGYQWYFNGAVLSDGARITGSKSAALAITAAQTNDAGGYLLVASNSSGFATSAVATLTVLIPPNIAIQPANQTVLVGSNALFQSGASGVPAPSYQWCFNGAALGDSTHITGSKSAALAITAAQTNDAGGYWLVASSSSGSATSIVAALTVLVPPAILTQPADQTVLLETGPTNAAFTVTTGGTVPLSYHWRKDGVSLDNNGRASGATNSTLTITGVQADDAGNYSVIVTNVAGGVTSAVAVLTVVTPPAITLPPIGRTNLAGTPANFTVTASGSAPLIYQWQFNGATLAGATNTSLALTNVQPGDAGNYTVVVTNLARAVTSAVAVLTVVVPATITVQPSSRTNLVGTSASFSAAASGSAPLIYQWQFNGTNLAGATGTNLVLASVQLSDAGNYTFVATNFVGGATSAVAVLTVVVVPPSITSPPLSRTNSAGTVASFSAAASGSPPLKYQWQFNGASLAGATTTNLVLDSVQPGNAGNYSLVVTNAGGAITSAPAVLTVILPPCALAASNLVSWWPGENSLTDMLARNNGTNAGSGIVGFGPGVVGQAFIFDGLHRDRVDLGNPASLHLQDLTIEAWVKRSSATDISLDDNGADGSSTSEGGMLFSYGVGGYGLGLFNNGRLILSRIDIDGVTSANTVSDLGWHHVAATKSGTTAMFYIDGAPASGPLFYPTSFTFGFPAAIGSRGDARGGTFYGMIDEPSVYSHALSAAEVQAIYQAGISGKCPLPPVIVIQPVGQTTNAGAHVQFQVTAGGLGPLTYQWRRNETNNLGANSSALNFTSVTRSNNGVYSVLISNSVGTMVSSNAPLKVLVAQRFAPPLMLANKSIVFPSKDADGGLLSPSDLPAFTALASTNLVNWSALPGALSLTNGQLLLQDPHQSNYPARFYRILEQ